MSSFFKNTRKLSIILSALLLVITLTAGSFAYAANGLHARQEGEDPQDGEDFGNFTYAEDLPDAASPLDDLVKPASYKPPVEMRGVYLVPGADFIKSKTVGEDAVRSEIDKAVADAKSLDMNSVIIDTVYNDSVIFETADANMLMPGFDIMRYLVDACRAENLYVYAIFDASHYAGDLADKLAANAGEFAGKYSLDGVLIDGYATGPVDASYSDYIAEGGSMGFENYKRQGSANVVKTVAGAVHKASPDTRAGLLADAVWANADEDELGSATRAKYTSLISGNADTKAYVEHGFVDFVAVKAYSLLSDADEPFGEVASWWANVAAGSGAPMYIVHASDKIGANGWTYDEITKQAAEASKYGGYSGSIFNDMRKLPSSGQAPAVQVTPTVQAAAAQPEVVPVSTAQTQSSSGADDYEQYNGYADSGDESEDESEYEYEDEEEYGDEYDDGYDSDSSYGSGSGSGIIKSISPTGIIFGDGNETIAISAVAYRDATVSAEINGETVRLTLNKNSNTGDSQYGQFTGKYTVPEPDYDDDMQMLGGLSVTATYQGTTETMDGAYLKIGAEKTPVQIKTDQTRTYPANTKNNVPTPNMYPLPKGATDYAVGKAFSYTSAKKEKYTYVLLESGVRVETKDLKEISKGPSKNKISGMTVEATGDGYTYVILKTSQKVTYSFAYKGDSVQIKFNYTTSVPSSKNLSKNPLFSKATWSDGNKLTLTLNKSNGFMGYKGYYDSDGNLVFKFNNPPTSIKNAKIAIDPGHGGKDIGAPGSNSKYPESVITRAIAKQLAAQLEERGAKVYLMETAGVELLERVKMAEKWGADLLVSVHCNSAPNKNATGTEVYYFYPFSRPLAHYAAAGVSKSFDTTNRGARQSYYHMTLSPQMSSVLVECGFMTNKAEYAKLIKSSQQKKIAAGIVAGLEPSIKYAKTGVTGKGTESTGTKVSSSSIAEGEGDSDDESGEVYRMTGGGKVTELSFETDTILLDVGETATLEPYFYPENADDISLTWTSSSAAVSIDDDGTVTAEKAGNATITARTRDGSNKRATVRITVSEAGTNSFSDDGVALSKAGYVYIQDDYLTIYPGRKERVDILSSADKLVKNADFTWKSDDTSVATVDKYGVVTAKSEGYATITATGGDYTLTCNIDITKVKQDVTSIELDKTSATVVRNKTLALKATLYPKGATDKSVTWTSSNDRIAAVSSSGVVTAKNAGKCTITAKSKSGGYKATCEIQVVTKPIELDYIELLDPTLEMRKGSSETLYVEISPENATNGALVWKSSNPNIVSVDDEGTVTALKRGTATITVTAAADKSMSEKCKITVYD